MRAETGPLEFDDDWTGVFVRGDNALFYAKQLEKITYQIESKKDISSLDLFVLYDIMNLLSNANHHLENTTKQKLKKFEDCVLPEEKKEE